MKILAAIDRRYEPIICKCFAEAALSRLYTETKEKIAVQLDKGVFAFTSGDDAAWRDPDEDMFVVLELQPLHFNKEEGSL